MKSERKKKLKTEFYRYLAMIIACAIYALGTDVFLVHHSIVGGGVSGIATLLYVKTNQRLSMGLTTVIFNIPILALSLKFDGWKFVLRCLITIGVLSAFTELFTVIPSFTDEPILATIYGGVLQGLGVGLFIRFKVSSGGTELLAREIRHWFKFFSIPVWIAIMNAIIVVSGAIAMNKIENICYALILIFANTKVSDVVVTGINKSKMCYIITDHGEDLSDYLIHHSPRGITLIEGKGMYTKQSRQLLLTCVKPPQIEQLRAMVKEFDPNAFVIVTDANEVFGKGFTDIQDKY